MNLIQVATAFRALNLYAHQAHHMCKGATFMQDHAFFGELYSFAEDSYDSLVERSIGINDGDPNLSEIITKANDLISSLNDDFYSHCLGISKEICDEINVIKNYDVGTLNLLQGIHDNLSVFIYKMQRRA